MLRVEEESGRQGPALQAVCFSWVEGQAGGG